MYRIPIVLRRGGMDYLGLMACCCSTQSVSGGWNWSAQWRIEARDGRQQFRNGSIAIFDMAMRKKVTGTYGVLVLMAICAEFECVQKEVVECMRKTRMRPHPCRLPLAQFETCALSYRQNPLYIPLLSSSFQCLYYSAPLPLPRHSLEFEHNIRGHFRTLVAEGTRVNSITSKQP